MDPAQLTYAALGKLSSGYVAYQGNDCPTFVQELCLAPHLQPIWRPIGTVAQQFRWDIHPGTGDQVVVNPLEFGDRYPKNGAEATCKNLFPRLVLQPAGGIVEMNVSHVLAVDQVDGINRSLHRRGEPQQGLFTSLLIRDVHVHHDRALGPLLFERCYRQKEPRSADGRVTEILDGKPLALAAQHGAYASGGGCGIRGIRSLRIVANSQIILTDAACAVVQLV